MSELIEETLLAADGILLDEIDPNFYPVAHAARERLVAALEKTGPLYHDGRFFRAAEGETFSDRIEVIEGVRIASEVPIPD